MAERTRNIERLADALQACLNEAAQIGSEKTANLAVKLVEGRIDAKWGLRFDRQDETLRMIWKQVKGEGPLPIDEP